MPVGTSDGEVFEDGMSHSMEMPLRIPEGHYGGALHLNMNNPKPKGDDSVGFGNPQGSEDVPVANEAEQAQQAREAAASRTKQSVAPEGGREEGKATEAIVGAGEQIKKNFEDFPQQVVDMAKDTLTHPENIVGTGELSPALGMFGGVNGASLKDIIKLQQAKHLKFNTNTDELDIFRQTGWFKDTIDNLWKQFIPNTDTKLRLENLKASSNGGYEVPHTYIFPKEELRKEFQKYMESGGMAKISSTRRLVLSDIYQNSELFNRYPQFRNFFVKELFPRTTSELNISGRISQSKGINTPYDTIELKKGMSEDEIMNVIHHELQHFIQEHEGFSLGANTKTAGGYDRYRRIAGEIEARVAEGWRKVKSLAHMPYTPMEDPERFEAGEPIRNIGNEATKGKGPRIPPFSENEKPYKPYKPIDSKLTDEQKYYIQAFKGALDNSEEAKALIGYLKRTYSGNLDARKLAKAERVPELDVQVFLNKYKKELEAPEKVTEAALSLNGRVWTGKKHFDAFKKALDEGVVSLKDLYTKAEQGYVTNNGRFISHDEAAALKPKRSKTADSDLDEKISESIDDIVSRLRNNVDQRRELKRMLGKEGSIEGAAEALSIPVEAVKKFINKEGMSVSRLTKQPKSELKKKK